MLAIVSEDSEALWNESVSFSCLQCNVRGKKNLQWLLPSFFLLSWCAMWNAVQQCTQYYQTMYSLFTVNQAEITQGVTKPYLGRKIPKIRPAPKMTPQNKPWYSILITSSSCILEAIMQRNSVNSIVPLPSSSNLLIKSWRNLWRWCCR